MVCCGMGRDESVGSAWWRAYVLTMTLVSGVLGLAALCTVSALSGLSGRFKEGPASTRAFLVGTIGPRLVRFADRELFLGLARWRCRLTGRLAGRAPRLGGLAYRYFNVAVLAGVLSAVGALAALCVSLV